MKQFLPCAILVLTVAACGDSPVASDPTEPVTVAITVPATLGFGESDTASAVARNADGEELEDAVIVWGSAHEAIVQIDDDGMMMALRPGAALIRARAGAAADSAWVVVLTSEWREGEACGPIGYVNLPENGYYGTGITPGRTWNSGSQSGLTEYHGIPFFFASGIVYGIGRDSTLVGYDWFSGSGDFMDFLCAGDLAPHHTVGHLRWDPWGHGQFNPDIDGLVVTQDQFAWNDADNDDYMLFRYSFTNTRSTPLANLRTGVVVDYDMYETAGDVGFLDTATGVAYTVDADSLNRTLSAAMFMVGVDVVSYFVARGGEDQPGRGDYYDWIASGSIDDGDGAASDVRQVVGASPMTLAPGETRTMWYALVAGSDRDALERNIAAARARIAEFD